MASMRCSLQDLKTTIISLEIIGGRLECCSIKTLTRPLASLVQWYSRFVQARATDVRGWSSANELMQHFFSAMRERDLRKATVGFDTHTAPGVEIFRFRKLNPEINMVENDEIMSELRMVKSADEIARMKKAARAAELGMLAATEALVAGATENDVAREAEYALRKAGS